jgi:hypothetical protein
VALIFFFLGFEIF